MAPCRAGTVGVPPFGVVDPMASEMEAALPGRGAIGCAGTAYRFMLQSVVVLAGRVRGKKPIPTPSPALIDEFTNVFIASLNAVHRVGSILMPVGASHALSDRKSTRLNSSHITISYA